MIGAAPHSVNKIILSTTCGAQSRHRAAQGELWTWPSRLSRAIASPPLPLLVGHQGCVPSNLGSVEPPAPQPPNSMSAEAHRGAALACSPLWAQFTLLNRLSYLCVFGKRRLRKRRDRQTLSCWHHTEHEEERVPLRTTPRRQCNNWLVIIAPRYPCHGVATLNAHLVQNIAPTHDSMKKKHGNYPPERDSNAWMRSRWFKCSSTAGSTLKNFSRGTH